MGALRTPPEEVIVHPNFLVIKKQNEYTGILPFETNLFSIMNSNLENQKLHLLKEIENICHFYSVNMNLTPKKSDSSLNLMIRGQNESDLVIDCQTTLKQIDRIKSQNSGLKFDLPVSPLESIVFPLNDVPDSKKNLDQNILEIRSKYRFFLKTWVLKDVIAVYKGIISNLYPKVLDVGSRVKFSITVVPPALPSSSQIRPKMTMHRNWLVGGSLLLSSPIYNRLKILEQNIFQKLEKEVQMVMESKKTLSLNDLAFQDQYLQNHSIEEVQELIRELQFQR